MIETAKAPGQVNIEVISHTREQLSDILARYLIKRYGSRKYGEKPVRGPRTVFVGRGGYDEHLEPEFHECEATLVASDLGIRHLAELQPILDYTLKVDRFGQGKGVFKFGRGVELLHNVYPDEPHRVRHWAHVLIEASIEAAKEGLPKISVAPETVLTFITQAYVVVKEEFGAEVRTYPEVALAELSSQPPFEPFGVEHCTELLWSKFRQLPHRPTPVEWIADCLRAEFLRQKLFLACKEDARRAKVIPITIRGQGCELLRISSDRQLIHSFLFSQNKSAVAVVVRRSSGHVQIFRRNRAPIRVDMAAVVAFIRAAEQQERGLATSPWLELVSQQGPDNLRGCWFFHHATQNVLNGSLTTEGIETTRLADDANIQCLIQGLDDLYSEFRRQFHRVHGVEG